jgi:hypothetical protein
MRKSLFLINARQHKTKKAHLAMRLKTLQLCSTLPYSEATAALSETHVSLPSPASIPFLWTTNATSKPKSVAAKCCQGRRFYSTGGLEWR